MQSSEFHYLQREFLMNARANLVRCILFGSLVIVAIGCERAQYKITLEPTDQGLKRSLAFDSPVQDDNGNPGYSDDEVELLEKIAMAYGIDAKNENGDVTNRFSGVFPNRMPQDIGGRGEYRRWKNTLGSASVYAERLGGSDDLVASLQWWTKNADTLVDHVDAWLAAELKDEDGYDDLHEFVTNDFRRDIQNLALYTWTLRFNKASEANESAFFERAMRAAQYFCERGYFELEQVPEIARAIGENDATEHPQRLLQIVQRFIATKMGVKRDQPIPKSLNFIAHQKSLQKSGNDYLQSTDEYKRLLRKWENSNRAKPKPSPSDAVNEIFPGYSINLFGGKNIGLKLKSVDEPIATNGKWDEESEALTWRDSVAVQNPTDQSYPMFAYAIWANPNEPSQTKHFGRIVLTAEGLLQYSVWYAGLDDKEIDQWDSFLETITAGTPQSDVRKKLRTFRFSHEPPALDDDRSNKDLAGQVRPLFLRGLDKDE